MKQLRFSHISALYEIEGQPDLIVLGAYDEDKKFLWINGSIERAENPDQLDTDLGGQTYTVLVNSEGDLLEAMVVDVGDLYRMSGQPTDTINAFTTIALLLALADEERDRLSQEVS